MSIQAVAWALKQDPGNSTAKLALIALADCHNEQMGCYPAQKYVAGVANCTTRSVRTHLNALEAKGLIKIIPTGGAAGGRAENLYLLAFDSFAFPEELPERFSGGVIGKMMGGLPETATSSNPSHSPVKEEPYREPMDDLFGGETTIVIAPPFFSNATLHQMFDELWQVHRKGPRGRAIEEYKKAIVKKGIPHEHMLACLKLYVASFKGDFSGAALMRWIRDERWEEQEHLLASTKAGAAGSKVIAGSAARFVS